MIKKIETTKESYGKEARVYDYITRVLASFAEFYHYDYTKSSLMEWDSLYDKQQNQPVVRENGFLGRIRAFYEQGLVDLGNHQKWYYQEEVFSKTQLTEYGYLTFGDFDESVMADMMALGVRILEAFGVRNFRLKVDPQQCDQEKLFRYLDALDMDYEQASLSLEHISGVLFQIVKTDLNGQEKCLLQGGSFNEFTKRFEQFPCSVFGIYGYDEDLVCETNYVPEEEMLDVVITYETEEELEHALYLAQELRLNGFKTEWISFQMAGEIQQKYPTKYVIALSKDDIRNDEVSLLDLYTKETKHVKEMDLVNHLDMNF